MIWCDESIKPVRPLAISMKGSHLDTFWVNLPRPAVVDSRLQVDEDCSRTIAFLAVQCYLATSTQ
jgi:hypothetical protein